MSLRPVRGSVPLILAGILACTSIACEDSAAKASDAAATVYLIELKSGSESTFQRAAALTRANKQEDANGLLRIRLDGLEEQVTKYIVTDPALVQSDRERIIEAVRSEQRQIHDLLGK
jgi:hypothetical protein